MKIDFETLREINIPHLNQGEGAVAAKLYGDPQNKLMISRLVPGSSIGLHTHTTSSEINYVLAGTGSAICDGQEEHLRPGICHYCPKGSAHSIINDGTEELRLFTVVPEQ